MSAKHMIFASALTLSFSAFGSSICNDPLQKICTDTKDIRIERQKYVEQLKGEILAEAKKNADPRIEEMKRQIKPFHFIKRLIQTYKIKNQEIMRAAKRRIGDIETVVTSKENVAKIKSYMFQAIEASPFDQNTKGQFKDRIESIVVGNFADFIERTGLEDSAIAQFLNNACGSDGMIDNAFATTLKGDRYVLICPGFLITLKQKASDEERFNSILHAISHEMGHHIDNSKVEKGLYDPFLKCVANHYADGFVKSKSDDKFCKSQDTKKEDCQMKVATSHAGELVADQWGIEVTALHAKAERYSFDQSEELLVNSWAKLCGTGDEGIHPEGNFRIGVMMRKSSSLSEVLACGAPADDIPGCGLAGDVKSQSTGLF